MNEHPREKAAFGAGVLLCLAIALPAQDRAAERFQVAMGLMQRELHEEAARQLQRFLQENPDHPLAPEAWYRLGTCEEAQQQHERAIAAYRKALERARTLRVRPECRYRLGTLLKSTEPPQPALAEVQFRKLVEEEANDHYLRAPSLYAAGECLRDLGQEEAALQSFLGAAEAAKQDATWGMPALYQAGFALMRLERFAEAQRAFATAADRFQQHPAQVECRFLEGEAALRAGNTARAEQAFADVRRAGGEFVDDALMGAARAAAAAGRKDQALALYREVVTRHADSPFVARARVEAGRLLLERGDAAAAAELLGALDGAGAGGSAVDAVDGGSALPAGERLLGLELRGRALLEQKDAKGAAACFREALAANPAPDAAARARLAYDLGEALAMLEAWADALAAYRDAQRAAAEGKTPDRDLQGDAVYGECLALDRLGQHEESLRCAERLLREYAGHRLVALAQFAVGENLFALERWPEAERAFAQVPEHALGRRAAFKLAWCAYLQQAWAEAAQRFAALAPGRGDGDAALDVAEESLSMAALSWLQAGNEAEALAAADRYRARHPRGPHLARTERVAARVLRQRGDLRAAAQRLAAAVAAAPAGDAAPGDAPAAGAAEQRLELAEVLFQQGDFASARKGYAELAARDDAIGARALEGLAWCAFELGDDAACEQAAERALRHPAVGAAAPAVLQLLSGLYHRRERWADAERVAQRFLAEHADHASAPEMRFALGVAEARGGKANEARATLQALAEAGGASRSDRVWYELAWVCRNQGDEAAALAAFAQVAQGSNDQDLAGEARFHLGMAALARKDPKGAAEQLREVKGKFRPQALYRLGFALLEAERPGDALPLFDELLQAVDREHELWHEALFLAGECRYRREDHAGAAQRFAELLEARPEHARAQVARLHLGEAAVRLEHGEQAIAVLEEYLQRLAGAPAPADEALAKAAKGDEARANLWLGRARASRGEHERAEAAFGRVTDLSDGPLAAEAQFRIGECRRERGDLQGAVEAFVKLPILYAHPDWVPNGLLQAGRCYEALQQGDKAKKLFQELVERFPDAPASREAKARLRGV